MDIEKIDKRLYDDTIILGRLWKKECQTNEEIMNKKIFSWCALLSGMYIYKLKQNRLMWCVSEIFF